MPGDGFVRIEYVTHPTAERFAVSHAHVPVRSRIVEVDSNQSPGGGAAELDIQYFEAHFAGNRLGQSQYFRRLGSQISSPRSAGVWRGPANKKGGQEPTPAEAPDVVRFLPHAQKHIKEAQGR